MVPLLANGQPDKAQIQARADRLDDANSLTTLIIWTHRRGRVVEFVDTDRTPRRADRADAREATRSRVHGGSPLYTEANGAAGRRSALPGDAASRLAQRDATSCSRCSSHVDYVGQATARRAHRLPRRRARRPRRRDRCSGSRFSSRLLRRLRLLQRREPHARRARSEHARRAPGHRLGRDRRAGARRSRRCTRACASRRTRAARSSPRRRTSCARR